MVISACVPAGENWNAQVAKSAQRSPKILSDAEAESYVTTLLQHFADRLSDWEDTFLRDVKITYLDRGLTARLTEKQRDKIDAIIERAAQQHGRRG